MMHMTPGLMNLAILRGEFTTLSLIPLDNPALLNTGMLSKLNPLILKSSGPILAGSTNTPLRKPSTKPLNGLLTPLGILWLVTLSRFGLHAQVATMPRFRADPRQRHMDRPKRIHSCAIMKKDYAIRFRTDQSDYYFLPDQDFDWTYSVYGMSPKAFLMTCQNHLARL